MLKKLKYIGIVCSTLLCTVISFLVSIAISGICTGRNEGSMSVNTCIYGGSTLVKLANYGYTFLFLGLFLAFIPLVLRLTGIIGGWAYWKKFPEKCTAMTGKILIGINVLMLSIALITKIVMIIIHL